MQQQQRFILALIASAAVLILWNYVFPPVKPPQPNANVNANAQQAAQASPQATAQPTATVSPTPAQAAQSPSSPADNVPPRKIRVVTPLYEATFDTRGAIVTSWIIKKNKNTGRDIHASSPNKDDRKPLELIPTPPAEVSADQIFHPLQITTGDAAADAVLAGRNFRAVGANSETGDETINVLNGSKQLDFVIHDDATGLDGTKRITFFADRYIADLELRLSRSNQAVPQAKLAIGPSVGDQGIDHYTFYLYAPEGIAVVNGTEQRINAQEVHSDRRSTGFFSRIFEGLGLKTPVMKPADREVIDGSVQWAGVGDTYFGMIAVPSKPVSGLEYRTIAYEPKTNGKAEQRFLITGFVPIPTDGSKTALYVGPKDHSLLDEAS